MRMTFSRNLWSILGALAVIAVPLAVRAAPIEVYGRLPSLDDVMVSPDGSRIAYLTTGENQQRVVVLNLADHHLVKALDVGKIKLRSLEWVDDRYLLLLMTKAAQIPGLQGPKHEWVQVIAYDLKADTTIPLDMSVKIYTTLNATWGKPIIRHTEAGTKLYLKGYHVSVTTLPALFAVDLDKRETTVVSAGDAQTEDWLLDSNGTVVADQNYDTKTQQWWLRILEGKEMVTVASGTGRIEHTEIVGIDPDGNSMIVVRLKDGDPVWQRLSLADGKWGDIIGSDLPFTGLIESHTTGRIVGAALTGPPWAHFFDPKLEDRWKATVKAMPKARLVLSSMSDDFSKIVVQVESPALGYEYRLVDFTTGKADSIGPVYEGLDHVADVREITYAAADGMKIPAWLTLPPGKEPKNLPLVVMPHGGPAAADGPEFDWWSQALADQGYAVLRPNFRGSDLGWNFMVAGFGEWGRKMQTDLSDGVRYLAGEGTIDPKRVCIVGASYGGYAALAGVSLDPGVYRCAVSVAGISDLKEFLSWVDDNHPDGLTQRYWDRYMGVTSRRDPVLKKLSPIHHIDDITAPVLLIHGKDDTVVPYDQSDDMADELKSAGKKVQLVTLKDEDHWLSRSPTRLQMLKASIDFLKANNPPD